MQMRHSATRGPVARIDQLVVTETADEVLVYDTDKHHIHHLNATTAAVWRHADGQHTVTDLAREAGAALGAETDEATVRLALTRLDAAGLLAEPLAAELRMSRMSRRTFMQRAGVAGAIAVPAIVSTTAAVSAQSPGENPLCNTGCGAWWLWLPSTGWVKQGDNCWEASDACIECQGTVYWFLNVAWISDGSCGGAPSVAARSAGSVWVEVSRDQVPAYLEGYLDEESGKEESTVTSESESMGDDGITDETTDGTTGQNVGDGDTGEGGDTGAGEGDTGAPTGGEGGTGENPPADGGSGENPPAGDDDAPDGSGQGQ